MKKIATLALFLAACAPQAADETNATGNETAAAAPAGAGNALTGLYQGGPADRPNQLCMVGGGNGPVQFGLVVWGSNMHSCSGTGTASRERDGLRLAMAGDSECAITAAFANGTITLPTSLPAGCAYYCGARAQLGGASFTRIGTTRADALKAKDLVGDSLCQGL